MSSKNNHKTSLPFFFKDSKLKVENEKLKVENEKLKVENKKLKDENVSSKEQSNDKSNNKLWKAIIILAIFLVISQIVIGITFLSKIPFFGNSPLIKAGLWLTLIAACITGVQLIKPQDGDWLIKGVQTGAWCVLAGLIFTLPLAASTFVASLVNDNKEPEQNQISEERNVDEPPPHQNTEPPIIPPQETTVPTETPTELITERPTPPPHDCMKDGCEVCIYFYNSQLIQN
ncbi:MAG: hypothetical protein FWG70_03930 [Oscillospiraceae bacterium]|nr:hypothetical protein [Oscillospiraceae bacterium]